MVRVRVRVSRRSLCSKRLECGSRRRRIASTTSVMRLSGQTHDSSRNLSAVVSGSRAPSQRERSAGSTGGAACADLVRVRVRVRLGLG